MFGSVPARYGNIDAAAKAWNARAEETPGQQACIKLKKAVALLESMRRNCINPEHYDDPMRMAKAEALRLAISSLKNDIG